MQLFANLFDGLRGLLILHHRSQRDDSQLARTAVANLRDESLRETIGEPFLLWAIAEVTKGKHSEDEWPLLGYRRTGHS